MVHGRNIWKEWASDARKAGERERIICDPSLDGETTLAHQNDDQDDEQIGN